MKVFQYLKPKFLSTTSRTEGVETEALEIIKDEKRFYIFPGESPDVAKKLSKSLQHSKASEEGSDMVSKKFALKSLQTVLVEHFGRKVEDYDLHEVRNFTVSKTTLDLKDDEVIKFGAFSTTGKRLKEQSNSFKLYYLDKICNKDELVKNYVDKENGRLWNQIFAKHFTCAISEVDITHDANGDPIEYKKFPTNKIVLATCVGFDLSAHRLTGVHYGDFLRYVERIDGKPIIDEQNKNAKEMELWKDAYNGWCRLGYKPTTKYKLKDDLLKQDYKLQFALMFHALKEQGIQVPTLAAIGCGVFGWSFCPLYVETVAQAYKEVLAENDYGFKAVIIAEVRDENLTIFNEVFSKKDIKLKVPVIFIKSDIMDVARIVSANYHTCIHNAGDLWEFGQFFESRGSLEEYCARMTTGYLSQHYLLNPNVTNKQKYIPVAIDQLGIKVDPSHVEKLEQYVKDIKSFK